MPAPAIRRPVVAGMFYPADPATASSTAARLLASGPAGAGAAGAPAEIPAIAAVCPHAGWQYSGALAGRLAAAIAVPQRVLILAPNHTGRGERGAVWPDGTWRLPGLEVPVDAMFCRALCDESTLLGPDRAAHEDEHAIEVLLPLLAARQPALRIAPVVLGGLTYGECETLAAAITRAVRAADAPTLILASTDMNHYRPEAETRELDAKALAPLEALDPHGLFDTVRREGITMCGYIPTTVTLLAARTLGATRTTRIGYATSADANDDRDRVVGYAAVAVY
jgi:AmmeMemoRadiSam system protein B